MFYFSLSLSLLTKATFFQNAEITTNSDAMYVEPLYSTREHGTLIHHSYLICSCPRETFFFLSAVFLCNGVTAITRCCLKYAINLKKAETKLYSFPFIFHISYLDWGTCQGEAYAHTYLRSWCKWTNSPKLALVSRVCTDKLVITVIHKLQPSDAWCTCASLA